MRFTAEVLGGLVMYFVGRVSEIRYLRRHGYIKEDA